MPVPLHVPAASLRIAVVRTLAYWIFLTLVCTSAQLSGLVAVHIWPPGTLSLRELPLILRFAAVKVRPHPAAGLFPIVAVLETSPLGRAEPVKVKVLALANDPTPATVQRFPFKTADGDDGLKQDP